MTGNITIPQKLQRGDTIGIIAPAGQIADHNRFEQGIKILNEMGFETRFPRNLWPGTGYLADSDSNRIAEVCDVFMDTEIHGVMAARGGYGCLRLLQHLDINTIRQNPKVFVGFSDISILLNQFVQNANMLCFHGPVVTSLCDCTHDALERFYNCITGNWQRTISPSKLEILRGSENVSGKLVGGNLSTLLTLLGTPYDTTWQDCILVLEDIGEPVYRLDRMITQLGLSDKLNQPAGILLGDFTLNQSQDTLDKIRYTEYIWERILDLTAHAKIPVWGNFPTGHYVQNLTLPFGATATMDSKSGELLFH